jgi:hypothetical protein
MSLNEQKPASSLIVDPAEISRKEIQNRFGTRHEVITNLAFGKHVTIMVVETDEAVSGEDYLLLEEVLKNQFGVQSMQTVFDATIPAGLENDQCYDLHITGHLRVAEMRDEA